MKVCRVKVNGAQLLMHNRQLADPLNAFVRAKAKITSKRKKTDDDHLKISELEFLGGLYLNEDERYIIPDKNIKAMLGDAAKSFKEGPKCKEGITILNHSILNADEIKLSAKQRFDKECYRREPLKQGMSVIIRTRPVFNNWSAEFEIFYDESLIDPDMIDRWLDTAARYKGIGDGRPSFGRFEIKEIVHQELKSNAA